MFDKQTVDNERGGGPKVCRRDKGRRERRRDRVLMDPSMPRIDGNDEKSIITDAFSDVDDARFTHQHASNSLETLGISLAWRRSSAIRVMIIVPIDRQDRHAHHQSVWPRLRAVGCSSCTGSRQTHSAAGPAVGGYIRSLLVIPPYT